MKKWIEGNCRRCGLIFSIPSKSSELILCPACDAVVEVSLPPPQNENSPSPNRRRRKKRRWYINGGPMKARH